MSHFALSNMFEQALQAVNPALSLAYWDFTMESTFYDPTTFRDSPVFEDDWFGDAYAIDTTLHTTSSGRWAYVPTMRNAVNFSSVVNPYGMLRSPVSLLQYVVLFILSLFDSGMTIVLRM